MNGLGFVAAVAVFVLLYVLALVAVDAVRDRREQRIAADRRRHPAMCARRIGGTR